MKKIFKIILYSLLSLLVLVIVAIVVLPRIIDPNDYKPQMVALVKKHTGRDLVINGDIKLSVFPWLGFDIGAMQLNNAATFKDQRFVSIEHAKAQLRLLSLFSDELQVGELELLGLQVNLQTDPAGKNNWDELLATTPTQPATATTPATPGAASAPARKIRVENILVHNATLRWDNQLSHQLIELSNISLQAGPLSQDHLPLQLSLGFALSQLQGKLQLTTALNIDLTRQHLVLSEFNLQLDADGKSLPMSPLHTQLDIPTLVIDKQQQQIQANAFTLQAGELRSTGQITLSQFDKPQIRFGLAIATLDLNPWLPAAEKTPAATPTAASNPTVTSPAPAATPTLPASLDAQGTISVDRLQFRQYQASKLNMPVLVKNSRVRLQPTLQLYEGELHGDWQLNTQAQPSRWQLHNELRGLALGPLVKAIANHDLINARAEVVADLTSEGLDPDTLLRHLNGTARLQLDKTQLVNFDLRNWLVGGFYDRLHKPRPVADNKERTVFDTLSASLTIGNGVVTNRDLLATTDKSQLTGSGQIDLVAQSIDYTLNYTHKVPFIVSLGDNDIDLRDQFIAIPIRGAWSNIATPKPDIAGLLKRLQQHALENKKTEAKQKVEKKIETEGKKLLQKFLNR